MEEHTRRQAQHSTAQNSTAQYHSSTLTQSYQTLTHFDLLHVLHCRLLHVVLVDGLVEVHVTQVNHSGQDSVHGVQLVVTETQRLETFHHLVELFHVGLSWTPRGNDACPSCSCLDSTALACPPPPDRRACSRRYGSSARLCVVWVQQKGLNNAKQHTDNSRYSLCLPHHPGLLEEVHRDLGTSHLAQPGVGYDQVPVDRKTMLAERERKISGFYWKGKER
ncbi:hypothetical protein E2C01_037313 [Portunus trituberculatus]|uniref:Uncharacterized protein n=1 Tax=Portunus trituberculatus TaxID=210409 RepID=A0A5B7FB37_PORTR|nr:hypothetical protein [Portunus trituberculatus]